MHGFASHKNRHKMYGIWSSQRQRIRNKNNKDYKNYGGRGLEFDVLFDSFPFWLSYIESLDNCYEDGYSIDRMDNDVGYIFGNMRWSTKSQQSSNQRCRKSITNSKYITIHREKFCVRVGSSKTGKIFLGSFCSIEEAEKVRDNYLSSSR